MRPSIMRTHIAFLSGSNHEKYVTNYVGDCVTRFSETHNTIVIGTGKSGSSRIPTASDLQNTPYDDPFDG